jgi:hypothetical protein
MLMETDPYSAFRAELRQAGYYSPSTESMGSWSRIIPCTQGPPEFDRYNGRSFWVSLVAEAWYAGTWGGSIYRLPDGDQLMSLTLAFLGDSGSMADFSDEIKAKYGLIELDDDESERILPDERLFE